MKKILLCFLLIFTIIASSFTVYAAEETLTLTKEYVNSTADLNGTYVIQITKKVTDIRDGAFSDLKNLREFEVDEDNQYYASYNGCLYNKDFSTLICVPQNIDSIHIHKNVYGYLSHALDGLPQQKVDTALAYFNSTDTDLKKKEEKSVKTEATNESTTVSNTVYGQKETVTNTNEQENKSSGPSRSSSTDFSQYVYTENGRTYFKYTGHGDSAIIIPEGVEIVRDFTEKTFDFNEEITYVYIPSSVLSLSYMNMFNGDCKDNNGYCCLYSCPNLKTVESDAGNIRVDADGVVYRPLKGGGRIDMWSPYYKKVFDRSEYQNAIPEFYN